MPNCKIVTVIKLQKTDLFVPSGIITASHVHSPCFGDQVDIIFGMCSIQISNSFNLSVHLMLPVVNKCIIGCSRQEHIGG